MNRKAFIFTLDSILAIMLALTLIIASINFLSGDNSQTNMLLLKDISLDVLTVLEKDSTFENFDSTSIDSFLSSLTNNSCMNLTLYNPQNHAILNTSRENCLSSDNIIVARRIFIFNNTAYYAELKSWYR